MKFFTNENPGTSGDNKVISRTLLKIAVVSRHYMQQPGALIPQHGELWRCRIVKEVNTGNKGAFILDPIEKIDDKSIVHLVPGLFCKRLIKGRLIVYPKNPGLNWILPLVHKKMMADTYKAHCIIVQLDASSQDLAECEAEAARDVSGYGHTGE